FAYYADRICTYALQNNHANTNLQEPTWLRHRLYPFVKRLALNTPEAPIGMETLEKEKEIAPAEVRSVVLVFKSPDKLLVTSIASEGNKTFILSSCSVNLDL